MRLKRQIAVLSMGLLIAGCALLALLWAMSWRQAAAQAQEASTIRVTLWGLALWVLIVHAVIGIVVYVSAKRRIGDFADNIGDLRCGGTWTRRLAEHTGDEFCSLAREINRLLEYAERDVWRGTRRQRLLRRVNGHLERRVAQRTMQAEQRAQDLAVMARDLTEAEQRERRRLAQLCHDHLQPLLVAAKLRMQLSCEKESDVWNAGISDAVNLVDQAIAGTRCLTLDLSPPVLQSGGLVAALDWLARRMEQLHCLHVQVEALIDYEPTCPKMRIVLFDAVRELLFNVVKHAQVDHAWVRVLDRDGALRIEIADKGCGFEAAAPDRRGDQNDHYGLSSLQRRLQGFGGTLTICSEPGNGTCCILAVPMRQRISNFGGQRLSGLVSAAAS